MTSETLKSCPFCGGEAHIEKYCDECSVEINFECRYDKEPNAICSLGEKVFWVEHDCTGIDGENLGTIGTGCYASAAEAIVAWNARAELGSEPPYGELLRCLKNDWHISASWDGLRKFWCIELTEDGVKLRDATHGTLTAEQVREAIEANSWPEQSMILEFSDSSWQAIADELNAELGSGTCKLLVDGDLLHCSNCGGAAEKQSWAYWSYCPNCGAKVVGE